MVVRVVGKRLLCCVVSGLLADVRACGPSEPTKGCTKLGGAEGVGRHTWQGEGGECSG